MLPSKTDAHSPSEMFPPPWTARDEIEEEPTNLLARSRDLQVLVSVIACAGVRSCAYRIVGDVDAARILSHHERDSDSDRPA